MYQCWFQVLGVPQVKFKTGPCTWRARRDQSNRQATPDRSMASITSWGTDILSLSWVAARWDISTHPHTRRILRVYIEALTDSVTVQNPDGVNTLLSKAASLKLFLVWEWWAESTFQGQGRNQWAWLTGSSSGGNRQPHPLHDLLQKLAL